VKPALAFLKARWLVVVLVAVSIVVVPVCWVMAGRMAESVHADFQKKVETATKPLVSSKVTYEFTPVDPGAQAQRLEKSHAPNEALNAYFKGVLTQQQQSADAAILAALRFNQGLGADAKPDALRAQAVEGFFPNVDANNRASLIDFAARYLEGSFPALLKRFNAGASTDQVRLANDLRSERQRLLRETLGPSRNDAAQLSAEELKSIDDSIRNERVRRYRADASKIDFYADIKALGLPAFSDREVPSVVQTWDWQERYWITEDILAAIALANGHTTPRQPDRAGGVDNAVVKRLVELTIEPSRWGFDNRPAQGGGGGGNPFTDPGAGGGGRLGGGGGGGGQGGDTPAPAGLTQGPGGVPIDPSVSLTGRISGPGIDNKLFDVRKVKLVAVVATQDLAKFIDAIGRVNFMTVLDVRIDKADFIEDLRSGFYYGDRHVSQVTMTIETIWLRQWTEKLMPREVRVQLGIDQAPSGDGQPADPNAQPGATPGETPKPPAAPPAG
jgi:hypothetical protein